MNLLARALSFWKLRASWLGDGGQPVPQALANARSAICLTCPKNQPNPIREALLRPAVNQLLPMKAQMQLAVPGEDGLRVCQGCECLLVWKVWVPLPHILATTERAELSQANPRCWILSETEP